MGNAINPHPKFRSLSNQIQDLQLINANQHKSPLVCFTDSLPKESFDVYICFLINNFYKNILAIYTQIFSELQTPILQ